MPARILLAVLALAVAAWLALSLHDQHYLDQATKIAARDPQNSSPARLRSIASALHKSERWNPSTRPRVLLADVELADRKPGRAIALVRPVLRAEPQNIEAWFVLVLAGHQRHDTRGAAAAQRRIDRLSPLSSR